MTLELFNFQVDAVEELLAKTRSATAESVQDDQAVSFSAPTGAGKTVMATALIERIAEGDEKTPSDEQATFLWLTDQPELNEQTRRKMLEHSSALGYSQLVTVENDFDQETFDSGKVYFLNTQKLAKTARLVSHGNHRTFTIWETITNTVKARGGHFVLIMDEAHRGMTESADDRRRADTIAQKFIKGKGRETPPVPVVLGISATPERFEDLVRGTGRTVRSVLVDEEDVRSSGLLKDMIILHHPLEEQPSDITMLRAAAKKTFEYEECWRRYADEHNDAPVDPLLVVQVQDAPTDSDKLSRTDLAGALAAVDEELGFLPDHAYAHAFQHGHEVEIGDHTVRYLAPSDIQNDPDVKVVLFKTALNTGWDCPRAEVMMSFRPGEDPTAIAQLVGRMVRTPLARRIEIDEFLNTVGLYLPYYNEQELARVVERLSRSDPEFLPPTDVWRAGEQTELVRRDGSDELFDALTSTPSYEVPRRPSSNQVRRLGKLARRLANHGIVPDAVDAAHELLVDTLREQHEAVRDAPEFKKIVDDKAILSIAAHQWEYGAGLTSTTTINIDVARENVDDLFAYAGRKLGEGLHKQYWRHLVNMEGTDPSAAKLEVFGLTISSGVIDAVQTVAKHQVRQWLVGWQAAINSLPPEDQQGYSDIRQLATDPELRPRSYPHRVNWTVAGDECKRHLYVDDDGSFHDDLSSWERQALAEELSRDDVVGWVRNPDRKDWSLCVPYKDDGGHWSGLYPDILVVRETEGGLIVDILDPHTPSLSDAAPKARGLASYASKHYHQFGRIEMIARVKGEIKRLGLTEEDMLRKVMAVTNRAHLDRLFEEA